MKKYTSDFETCEWLEDETYVWAWCLCEIDNIENIIVGNSIETFIDYISKESCVLYFHNLKFDGEFIICYLLSLGFEEIYDIKDKRDKTFMTLISDMGIFYSIEIYFKIYNRKIIKCSIYDSLKIIPFPVKKMPKAFGLPYEKLELKYNKTRERGHILTKEETEYIKNDVRIVAMALKMMFDLGYEKMTIASNSLTSFKKTKGNMTFNRLFPQLSREMYEDLKQSYKGGFTYLNPIYKEKENGETINLDVNSLYPSQMRYKPMPYGDPVFFEGEYEEDNIYPLYIQRLSCSFELKKNKIPTIQIKNSRFFQENEYLTSSNGEIISLTLTNIDLKLFKEQYDIYFLRYDCGWKFKAMDHIFDEYIDYWMNIKMEATINKNSGLRTISKLFLNSLYGKFATNMKAQQKHPYLEDGKVLYRLGEEEEKKGLYIPIGAFITSYAREVTIRTSQAIKTYSIEKYGKDMYIYSDTDSIKTLLPLEELKQFCDIDDVKLGAWKYEGTATRSKFVRQKTYIMEFEEDGKKEVKITCAGMPEDCYKYVTWNKFKQGFKCGGKLTFKHVKGGVKLVETEFTIKSDVIKNMIKPFKNE